MQELKKIPLKPTVAVPEYHQSAIQMFLKCQKQYYFRYILGIKTPPTAALTVGSAVDAAITRNLIQKKRTGTDVSLEEVKDVYSTDFDIRAKDTEWGEDDQGQQKDVGLQCLAAHHREIAPTINPETVQENFVIETDAGYNLGGTIDLTDKRPTGEIDIADSKTSKSKYDDDPISKAIQPAMYDFAYQAVKGSPASGFRFDVMIKPTKTLPARTQRISGKVTPQDREWLFQTINEMHKSLQAGIALPAPEGAWWCSLRWCGYASAGVCPKFQKKG